MSAPLEPDDIIPPTHIKPPGNTAQERDATAKIIAKWLDDLLQVPGTKFKVGLDPFMSLIPGVGDFLSSSVSAVVIVESVRKGVSPSIIARMGVNMLINALLGIIPGIGAIFTAFYKSNSRNLLLLHRWQEGHKHEVRRSSRLFMVVVILILGAMMTCSLLVWSLFFWPLWKLLLG